MQFLYIGCKPGRFFKSCSGILALVVFYFICTAACCKGGVCPGRAVGNETPPNCGEEAKICLLPVPIKYQQASNWCWAAGGEMCMEYINNDGKTLCQCDMAVNNIAGCGDACTTDRSFPTGKCDKFYYPSDKCNKTAWPDFIDYGYAPAPFTTECALTFEDLQTQMFCYGKPTIFSWHWTVAGQTDQSHLMVATGYQVDHLGVRWIYVNDPAKGYLLMKYADYVRSSTHTHYRDYYNITKVGS